jgi:hypothetical protein
MNNESVGAVGLSTKYSVTCTRDGKVIWVEDFHNLVVTAGLDAILDAAFKTGLTSPAWYIGLVNDASFSAYTVGDTLASHSGWLETAGYSGNRKAFTPGSISAGSVSNLGSPAVFTMNTTVTVRGAFLANAASGSSGILYGVGDLSAPRSVIAADVLSVSVTLTAASN